MDVQTLAQILRDTQKAHHDYEVAERERRADPKWTDPDWPGWYAAHMLSTHKLTLSK